MPSSERRIGLGARPIPVYDYAPVISVEKLVKHYRVHSRPPGLLAAMRSVFHRTYETVRAVDGISFEIGAGERVGFLGPNGAGKTTTLKILAGLLHPTSGKAAVAAFEPRRRDAEFLRSIMLVTGQKQQLLWDLPPIETFELNRAIYDVPRAQYKETLDELVTLLELEPLLRKPTRQLPLGERMKCEIAAALVHRPKILFLDEPTIGLDVSMQSVVREFIKTYNERNKATVLLTSHYMDDVLAITPRVIVINQGRLTYDGTLEDLVHKTRPEKIVTLRFGAQVERSRLDEVLGASAGGPPAGRVLEQEPTLAVLQVEGGAMNVVVTRAIAQLPIVDLKVEDAPLEEVLADLFARGHAEAAR
jgi:ABC-2 type transport system ATP-binding protein